MPIRTRRWDDPVEPGDGTRILVCRYRPRGLRSEDETWDVWFAHLGPSRALHAAAYGKDGQPKLAFDEYRARFLEEMRTQSGALTGLAARVEAGETITLLCSSSCTDETRCHRSILRELIEARVRK